MPTLNQLNCLKKAITEAFTSSNAKSIQQGMEISRHKEFIFIRQHVVIFMLDGSLTFRHGELCTTVNSLEYVYLKKDIFIEYESGDGCNNFLVLTLKNELITEFTRIATLSINAGNITEAVIAGYTDCNLASYIDSLRSFFQLDGFIPDNLARIKLLELLFSFASSNQAILNHLTDRRAEQRPDITYVVEQNITESLSLRQLARLAGRSISSFRRDFISIYNMPPFRWIREQKLEKARELLLNTNMSITSICYTMGFENIAHFSRIFKSRFGQAPSALRIKAGRILPQLID